MPELPEVESIRRQLDKFLKGHVVQKIDIRNNKYELGDKSKIVGAKIVDARRFGKALVIDLSNNYSLVVHIKMTGQFIYQGPNLSSKGRSTSGRKTKPFYTKKVVGGVPGKHTHVIFYLDRGGVLYFNDYRRFGWMELVQTSDVEKQKFIKKLGHEFLKNLGVAEFSQILSRSKKPIKLLIMDQERMAGVGNIYANDALWLAKISPQRRANSLKQAEQKTLFDAIESVLKEGIKRGGASEVAYVTPDGAEGKYQDFTLVYGRDGEICKSCKKTIIKKIFLGGRGTYFCPACQPT
jgi:formamidopyrimidine-DNA glycosylase